MHVICLTKIFVLMSCRLGPVLLLDWCSADVVNGGFIFVSACEVLSMVSELQKENMNFSRADG